jgi:hypothetical protein
MFYVVICPNEGPFITDQPDDLEVVFQSEDQAAAERALARECSMWEGGQDEDEPDMNADFQ